MSKALDKAPKTSPYDHFTREQLLSELLMEIRIGKDFCALHAEQEREAERAAKDASYWSAQYREVSEMWQAAAKQRDELLGLLTELKADVEKLGWGQAYPGRNHALMDRVDMATSKSEPAHV